MHHAKKTQKIRNIYTAHIAESGYWVRIFYIVRTAEVRCTSNSCRIGAPNPETRKHQTAGRVSKGPPTTKGAQKTEDFEPSMRIRAGIALESAEKWQKRPPIPPLRSGRLRLLRKFNVHNRWKEEWRAYKVINPYIGLSQNTIWLKT